MVFKYLTFRVNDNFLNTRPGSPPAFSPSPPVASPRACNGCIGVIGNFGELQLRSRFRDGETTRDRLESESMSLDRSLPIIQPIRTTDFCQKLFEDVRIIEEVLQATNEFNDSNLIKHGHSGDLFRGILDDGIPVVIKKVDLRSIKKEVYPVELDFFGKVSHRRFVPFLGHCLERENEKFLVYKYMPNEDLASSLFRKTSSEDDSLQFLDWIKRLKIAVGAAEGLSYLHHECTPPLVHRDVQASSILLDDKYEVRLGSLSEVCAQEGDTHHSRISRLLRLQQSSEQGTSDSSTANCAYDVYCFGKVLLELVTGKLGLSASHDAETKELLEQTLSYINIYDMELVTKIVDPLLIVDEDLLEEVWAMAIVARSCLNPKPSQRPPMRYVLKALENPLEIVREENPGWEFEDYLF